MVSHAANPAAEVLGGRRIRVYFTSRDRYNRSHIGVLETDLREPTRLLYLSDEPLLRPGPAGTFDDSGAAVGCVVVRGARRHLYYLGWNLGVTVPWRNSIGLALSDGDFPRFEKYSMAPIVDRGPVDPFSLSYPLVRVEDGAWRMWYGSNLAWGPSQSDMAHVIKYAESNDGLAWRRDGRIAIGLGRAGEYAIAKPWVLKDAERYRMWYSHRGPSYRIGYAESVDGLTWRRLDDRVGIDVSSSSWDSDMIEYASVVDVDGDRFMLYNGNGYGRTGFGLAVLEQD
jgi:predicted GH43/DUF377 family glycosyl hydrolase